MQFLSLIRLCILASISTTLRKSSLECSLWPTCNMQAVAGAMCHVLLPLCVHCRLPIVERRRRLLFLFDPQREPVQTIGFRSGPFVGKTER